MGPSKKKKSCFTITRCFQKTKLNNAYSSCSVQTTKAKTSFGCFHISFYCGEAATSIVTQCHGFFFFHSWAIWVTIGRSRGNNPKVELRSCLVIKIGRVPFFSFLCAYGCVLLGGWVVMKVVGLGR